MQGVGCQVWGAGFGMQVLGRRVLGLQFFGAEGLGRRDWNLWWRISVWSS